VSFPVNLSVVIVNYNTRDLLLACIQSIIEHAPDAEVIVIDNVSTDGSADAVRGRFPASEYPYVRVIANTVNTYFSAGNNQGIAAARGRYILAMNPDMVVRGDVLSHLVAELDSDSHIGAVTTTLRNPDGTVQRTTSAHVSFEYLVLNYTFIGKILSKRKEHLNRALWYADWDRNGGDVRDVGVLPGSCILARRETWQQIGGFDARMPMYFSDDYFSLQVKRLGLRTVYIPHPTGIIHYEGASAKQVSARALRLYLHDLLVYTRLVFGRPAQWLLGVLLIPTWIVQHAKTR
jgi:GT2 family glycosyltransferase